MLAWNDAVFEISMNPRLTQGVACRIESPAFSEKPGFSSDELSAGLTYGFAP